MHDESAGPPAEAHGRGYQDGSARCNHGSSHFAAREDLRLEAATEVFLGTCRLVPRRRGELPEGGFPGGGEGIRGWSTKAHDKARENFPKHAGGKEYLKGGCKVETVGASRALRGLMNASGRRSAERRAAGPGEEER